MSNFEYTHAPTRALGACGEATLTKPGVTATLSHNMLLGMALLPYAAPRARYLGDRRKQKITRKGPRVAYKVE